MVSLFYQETGTGADPGITGGLQAYYGSGATRYGHCRCHCVYFNYFSGGRHGYDRTAGRRDVPDRGRHYAGPVAFQGDVKEMPPGVMGSRETVIPQELQYVEVIAVTAKSGYDANMETGEDTEEKELPSTVTLLVRPEQAKILAQLEAEGNIHLSLVYRGTTENAAKFIAAQDTILNELKAAEEAENEEGSTEEEAEQENSSPKEISEEE